MVWISSFFRYSIVVLAFIFMSCQSKPAPSFLDARKDLRLCIATDPIHLDVAKASDSVSAFLLRMIYEGLTRLDENSKPIPALAKSWLISDDGLTYTFHLRKAFWSNGQVVKAQDFVKAWQYLLDPQTASPNAYQLFPILHARLIALGQLSPSSIGARAIDEFTLEVKLEQPTPYFLQLLAFDSFYPSLVPSLGSKAIEDRISCGPFQLKSWKIKNELHLVSNPYYWDRSSVKLDNIRLLILAHAQTALHMYESNEIDWVGSPLTPLPSDASEALAKSGQLQVYQGSSTYWVNCNLEKIFLKNHKIRKALSLCLDRDKFSVNLGFQQKPAYRLVPPLISEETSFLLEFDSQQARELWKEGLAEMGLEKAPELTYIYNSSQMHAKVAQLLQAEWKQQLGLTVNLVGLDWAVFLQRARLGDFDLARFGWRAQFSDPVTFLEIFDSKEGSYNFSRFDDERFRAQMRQAQLCTKNDRINHLLEAEKLLLDGSSVIPLFFESHTYLKNPSLKGVIIGPLGRIDFKLAYWEKPNS